MRNKNVLKFKFSSPYLLKVLRLEYCLIHSQKIAFFYCFMSGDQGLWLVLIDRTDKFTTKALVVVVFYVLASN